MELDGQPVHVHEAEPVGDVPVLYLHGVPTSGADWAPFLARTGGLAPDLPGFGRSGKSGEHAYDLPFYAGWLDRFLEARGIERVRLVVHDWGVVGLIWAQRAPERVERLVVIDGVPLLPGYRWHATARVWRTPVAGEIAMGLTTRFGARRMLPRQVADTMWAGWDQGTQRAILRLYRAADPATLAAAGDRLVALACTSLVVWGGRDAFIGPEWGRAYAERLGAELDERPEAGHWPWLDDPGVIDRVAAFVAR
jgi:pimeloyl-ACP methyl ester carboxylesterase